MATSVFSTPVDNSGNAGFQAWATELINALLAINPAQLTQTADTGQLANPVVAARPGAINTAAGYWILKWDDGTTTPLYFKIEVGNGANVLNPMIWITVGTGSNGSGTLTGSVTTRSVACANGAPASTTTNYTSYLCCTTGGFSLGWKLGARGASATGMGGFATVRSIDDSGVVNNDGYVNYSITGSNAFQSQSVNLSNSTVFSATSISSVCIVPYGITASVVGGNAQYFRHFAAYPLGRPLGHIVTVIPGEFATGTSFHGESGSITDHTFLSPGTNWLLGTYNFAFIYE